MQLNVRLVECFRAVMTVGTVTAAAEMLHTSQPAVSRSIQQLEDTVGLPLFDRVKGRLVPTAQAAVLFDEVCNVFQGLDHLSRVAANLKAFQVGSVGIVCAPVFSNGFVAEASARFLERHGSVSLSVDTQLSPAIGTWVGAQRCDIGLAGYRLAPSGTLSQIFAEPDEVCVLPPGHPLASRDAIVPEDLDNVDFVFLGGNDPYRYRLDEVFERAKVTRRLVVETPNSASVCSMVLEGAGLGIVNPFTALEFVGRGLVMRRFVPKLPYTTTLLRAKFRPSSPLANLFVRQLEDTRDDYLARIGAELGR